MRSESRAEVMGSSRKVRSRVHGWVKDSHPWLLFAFFFCYFFFFLQNSTSFLEEDVSRVPPSSPRSNPVTRLFVFLRLLNLPPAGKPTDITTSPAVGGARHLPALVHEKHFCVWT
ncbi:hypothetical protein CHARACLAT_010178 [Characodon lateralis]|uniref:Uncharacterized protein n=1 Tax=Characodon lateralis TaxID=208331 RepID=A0ABU7DQC1_9TELE|nr:hypothetical protein [Characodon lateralis]